jgi:hypothetical protein
VKIKIISEQQTAHNKIVLAQQKVDRLFQSGKTRRDEEVKYWLEQLNAWTGYANELNDLARYGHIEIEKTIMSSGAFHVTVNHNGNYIKNISKRNIPQELLESIPTGADYRSNNPPCARCGAIGTEEHHWAPKAFFEDAEEWPKSYLCKKCHDLWHLTLTIPLRTLRKKEIRADVKPAA